MKRVVFIGVFLICSLCFKAQAQTRQYLMFNALVNSEDLNNPDYLYDGLWGYYYTDGHDNSFFSPFDKYCNCGIDPGFFDIDAANFFASTYDIDANLTAADFRDLDVTQVPFDINILLILLIGLATAIRINPIRNKLKWV